MLSKEANSKRFLDCAAALLEMTEMFVVRATDPVVPESIRLTGELWQELCFLYPEVKGAPFQPTNIRQGYCFYYRYGCCLQDPMSVRFEKVLNPTCS